MFNPFRKLTNVFNKGKSYYCFYCLREKNEWRRVSPYAGGIHTGGFTCYAGHGKLSKDEIIEYPVKLELYCPQCAMEGTITQVYGARLLNGKVLGYYSCPKHGSIPNPVSKRQAEIIKTSAQRQNRGKVQPNYEATGAFFNANEQYFARTTKEKKNWIKGLKSTLTSQKVKKIPYGFGWFVLYSIGGIAASRFSLGGSSMLPIFIGAGVMAFILEMITPAE